MMTLLSPRKMKHKNENPVLKGKKHPTPSGSGAELNFMSYPTAGRARDKASGKLLFKVTGVDNETCLVRGRKRR